MAWALASEIRSLDKKLSSEIDILDAVIDTKISEAEKEIKVDLSDIITESALDALGSGSIMVNTLTRYKATALTLVYYFGNYRKAETTDIEYFLGRYQELIKGIMDGSLKITDGDTDSGPKSSPGYTASTNNLQLYARKGVEGFVPDGATKDIVDL